MIIVITYKSIFVDTQIKLVFFINQRYMHVLYTYIYILKTRRLYIFVNIELILLLSKLTLKKKPSNTLILTFV
jgi:hypothetical protein